MAGLNIRVTAFLLSSILVVHGNIYQEDTYHVESYHRSYSDNDRSDTFDDENSKFPFDVPHPEIEDHDERPLSTLPRPAENNEPDVMQGSEVDKGFSNVFQDDKMINIKDPLRFNFDFSKGFPNPFPVVNGIDQDQRSPVWMPNDVNNNRPSWFPSDIAEGGSEITIRRPSRGQIKKKCRKIKGIPTPESGCCGVQMTRPPIVYPNKPWWPQYPGGRFVRSVDDEILPSPMIRGGNATDLHQFPWMVHININSEVPGTRQPYTCGGAIISSRYVLTAAHCMYGTFKNLKQIEVFLAEYNVYTFPIDCNGQGCIRNKIRNVEQVIVHPKFAIKFLHNDIALLRLSSDIYFSDYVRPICLPTKDITEQGEEPLVIAGWGLNGKTESNVKRAAIVKYVSEDKCKEAYSYKEDSMFCSIGDNGEDICKGDSGGPLMVYSEGKYFLSGVVSGKWNKKECGSSWPSIFNNVFYHLDWIKNYVQ